MRICGAHQKGKVFKTHMLKLYSRFIKEQMEADKALLERGSEGTREEYMMKGVGVRYPDCSADSIYYRLKASGWSMEDHKTACLELYKNRHGRPFDFYAGYEYLHDKNKFSSFRTKIEEECCGNRPIGKKKMRQIESDTNLVKAILSEVMVKNEPGAAKQSHSSASSGGNDNILDSIIDLSGGGSAGAGGTMVGEVLQNISNVIANVGSAVFTTDEMSLMYHNSILHSRI